MNRIIDYKNLSEQIEKWIKNYAQSNGIETLVIGVSGGIDSAVVSTLCSRTNIPTIAVGMPLNSKPENTRLSNLQLDFLSKLNVQTIEVELSDTFKSFENTIPHHFKSELASANSKSRLRMMTLYHIAANRNGLVVGTGNKVEDFGIGFFTKYGDGGVDISPIADLLKSEVRQLAAYLKVPQSILNAKPTDGLFGDDRSDEDQIGANYDELEWAMQQMELGKKGADFSGREADVFGIYNRLHSANQHKMQPIPVCLLPKDIY